MGLIRDVDPDLLAALAAPFHPVVLVFVDWPGDPVRVHSGRGVLAWGGHDWQGLAGLNPGEVVLPDEAASLAMTEGAAVVGGNPARIDEILGDAIAARGAEVEVWFGVVTQRAGTVLVGEPFSAFAGTVGGVSDEETPAGEIDQARLVRVQLVSGPSQRATSGAYHSWEDQRRVDATDTAGRWVSGALATTISELPKW